MITDNGGCELPPPRRGQQNKDTDLTGALDHIVDEVAETAGRLQGLNASMAALIQDGRGTQGCEMVPRQRGGVNGPCPLA